MMANTGVLIEMENGSVKSTSLGVLTAAAGQTIYALALDTDAADAKDTLAQYGAANIVLIQLDDAQMDMPDARARALAAAVKEYNLEALLATASAEGKDVMARLCAMMDKPLISDCVQIDVDAKTAKKSHFSGKTFAVIKADTDCLLATIRPNAIEPSPAEAAGEIIEFSPQIGDTAGVKIVEIKKNDQDELDLTEAPVVITGGRAIKAAENYSMLRECAKKLGAAVGASRAAVDAGYAPHSMQVGQTGKTVSPKLYIACGVSGAVQHFAGMKTSKVIVAINEDKDAPIFSKCDYGIVGDIFDVVPKLTEKL
jgi:electron transfer flavoprotein alpha subunit